MKTKEQKLLVARKLFNITNDHLVDMQCIIHGGFMMDTASFRNMLNNNEVIKKRYYNLYDRKERLRRLIWKLA